MITQTIETKKQMDDLVASRVRAIREQYESYKEVADALHLHYTYVRQMATGKNIPHNNMQLLKTIFRLAGDDTSKYRVWAVDGRGTLLCSVDMFPREGDVKTKLMVSWFSVYDNKIFPPGVTAIDEDVVGKSCLTLRGFRKEVFGKTKPTMRTINSLYKAIGYRLMVVVSS